MRKLLIIGMAITAFVRCDNFTDVSLPDNQLTAGAVFEDPVTANAALVDIYSKMRDNGSLTGHRTGFSNQFALYTDEMDFYGLPISVSFGFANNALLPTATEIENLWNSSYSHIYAANAVIEGVSASQSLPQEVVDRLTGEALFIRAFVHANLAAAFGDVPYVKTTDYRINKDIARTSYQEVLEQSVADLELALPFMAEEYLVSDRVRPNRYAAYALMARIRLWLGDWPGAADAASAVLNQNTLYAWQPDLGQAYFKDATTTVWQFMPGFPGDNTIEARTFNFETGPPPHAALSAALVSAFEPGDQRLVSWTREVTDGIQSWHHPYKYKESTNTGTSMEYSILLGTAELFLIRAEARAMQGDLIGAQQDLDVIRTRAGLAGTSATTQEGLVDAVLHERRVELFCEHGHRFIDLKRLGQLDSVLDTKPGWNTTDRLLPLPQRELLLNPNIAPQNEGY